jgi:hypothetical protein
MSYSMRCLVGPTFSEPGEERIPASRMKPSVTPGTTSSGISAFLVDRWDVLNESGATPLPQIPEEIDFLWVVHRWEQGYDWLPTWVARRGETTWRVHAEVAT